MRIHHLTGAQTVKADYLVLKYFKGDQPLISPFQNGRIIIATSPPNITGANSWNNFYRSIESILPRVDIINLEYFFAPMTPITKSLLEVSVKKISEQIPEVRIFVSVGSQDWISSEGSKFLNGLSDKTSKGIVFGTYYLENDLMNKGWAKTCLSKRSPTPLTFFAPKIGTGAHFVLYGTYGNGWGEYSPEFIGAFARNIMKLVRRYQLKDVWIEFRNDKGRMDFPLPTEEFAAFSFLEIELFDELPLDTIVLTPRLKSGKPEKPSTHNFRNFLKEWDRQLLLLDGLCM